MLTLQRGHTERVHHDASTYYIMVGKVMIPETDPAYDSNDFICDEHCGKNDLTKECK
jgi:hypothetical protein